MFDSSIQFEQLHPRLESSGSRANVVLLNNSSIVEVNYRSTGIVYRTGALNGQHSITWSAPTVIDGTSKYNTPAVAANATYAISTFHSSSEGVFKSIYLRYSTAKLP
jgi:hypothetical protein